MKCVGCQRRGTACLGQQFSPEGVAPPSVQAPDTEVNQRLDRFEKLLYRMLQKNETTSMGDRDGRFGKQASSSVEGDGDPVSRLNHPSGSRFISNNPKRVSEC
jgi:hypothetical protein